MFKNPPPLGHNKSSVSSQRSLKYRPDIDGLRAIAVLSVVLFHAFPDSIFRSGFAGVDIFFVISGFLISTIIFRGMNERMKGSGGGKPFSFIDFYSRRVRRIFPSLIFCLLTFLVLGHFVLLPDEYSLLWKHTAGASAYVSNLVLWSEAGDYFQTASQTKPLLHLWSLGIEEQFYLIWPLLLFIAYRLRFNILAITLIGALASFGFELSSVRSNPTAAFYSPFLRFWELMAGSILAWLKLYKAEMFRALAERTAPYFQKFLRKDQTKEECVGICCNILSALGLISILIGIFALNSRHFPGSKALYPVLGALFMIAAGKDAFLNRRLLSNRAMVWFGLISYPLYIWHWPFISFAWIVEGGLPELKVRLGCIALAVIMSAITYYLVEPRLRWGRYGGYKAAGLLSVMIAIGVTGLHEMRQGGEAVTAGDPEQPLIDAISSRLDGDNERCLKAVPDWNKLSDSRYFVKCRFEREPEENTIAIIGDSHGGHIYPGIISQTKDNEGAAVFPAACAIPLMGLHSGASPEDLKNLPTAAYSEHLLSEGFQYILNHKNVTKVILAHHPYCSWRNVVDTKNPGNHDFKSVIRDGFVRTYDALTKAGKEIYVIWDSPRYPDDQFLKCKASAVDRPYGARRSALSKAREICSAKPSGLVGLEANDYWKKVSLETAAGYRNIHFIDLGKFFCPGEVCSMLNGRGSLLYKDRHHLNIKGSIYAAPFIMEELRKQ